MIYKNLFGVTAICNYFFLGKSQAPELVQSSPAAAGVLQGNLTLKHLPKLMLTAKGVSQVYKNYKPSH